MTINSQIHWTFSEKSKNSILNLNKGKETENSKFQARFRVGKKISHFETKSRLRIMYK